MNSAVSSSDLPCRAQDELYLSFPSFLPPCKQSMAYGTKTAKEQRNRTSHKPSFFVLSNTIPFFHTTLVRTS